jgi:uncharacterized protein YukE
VILFTQRRHNIFSNTHFVTSCLTKKFEIDDFIAIPLKVRINCSRTSKEKNTKVLPGSTERGTESRGIPHTNDNSRSDASYTTSKSTSTATRSVQCDNPADKLLQGLETTTPSSELVSCGSSVQQNQQRCNIIYKKYSFGYFPPKGSSADPLKTDCNEKDNASGSVSTNGKTHRPTNLVSEDNYSGQSITSVRTCNEVEKGLHVALQNQPHITSVITSTEGHLEIDHTSATNVHAKQKFERIEAAEKSRSHTKDNDLQGSKSSANGNSSQSVNSVDAPSNDKTMQNIFVTSSNNHGLTTIKPATDSIVNITSTQKDSSSTYSDKASDFGNKVSAYNRPYNDDQMQRRLAQAQNLLDKSQNFQGSYDELQKLLNDITQLIKEIEYVSKWNSYSKHTYADNLEMCKKILQSCTDCLQAHNKKIETEVSFYQFITNS